MSTQSIKSDALEPDLDDLRGKGPKALYGGSQAIPRLRPGLCHTDSDCHFFVFTPGHFSHLDQRSTHHEQPVHHGTPGPGRHDSDGRGKN